jgi:HSP20 family molecular chaperone IbpA
MFFNLKRDLDSIFNVPIINIQDPFDELIDMRSRMMDVFDYNFPQLTLAIESPDNTESGTGIEIAKEGKSASPNLNSLSRLSRWHPRCDAHETEKEFLITAELPGLKKEEVNIEYDEDKHILTIKGEV